MKTSTRYSPEVRERAVQACRRSCNRSAFQRRAARDFEAVSRSLAVTSYTNVASPCTAEKPVPRAARTSSPCMFVWGTAMSLVLIGINKQTQNYPVAILRTRPSKGSAAERAKTSICRSVR